MKTNVSFKVDGRKVTLDRFGSELQREFRQGVSDTVVKRIQAIRCPIHGQAPRIVPRGGGASNLTWDVSGCCDKVVELARARLKA